MEIALVTLVTILFIVLYDNFKIRIIEQKEEVPKDVFNDLMNGKCNNDCENCTCKPTKLKEGVFFYDNADKIITVHRHQSKESTLKIEKSKQ